MFLLSLLCVAVSASAEELKINFEPGVYAIGNINVQDGWSKTGPFDVAVTNNTFNYSSFGTQSLRISNSITSGSFGDQTFSKSLVNEAGEKDAQNANLSGGARQQHFETSFDIATTQPYLEQKGLSLSVSPDRGDGARMSYLRFEDKTDGIHVFFDDYKDNEPFATTINDSINGCGDNDDFTETDIATISRTPHNLKIVMDFVDGPKNDLVKIYIDGILKKTGTSWEGYFNYCEGNQTRTVDSILFREGGSSVLANEGKGFLIDNLNLLSGEIKLTNKEQCKDNGWVAFNSLAFKNQGECVSYLERNPEASLNKK